MKLIVTMELESLEELGLLAKLSDHLDLKVPTPSASPCAPSQEATSQGGEPAPAPAPKGSGMMKKAEAALRAAGIDPSEHKHKGTGKDGMFTQADADKLIKGMAEAKRLAEQQAAAGGNGADPSGDAPEFSDVRAAFSTLVQAKGSDAAKAICAEYGVGKISALDASVYAEAIAKAQAAASA